MIKKWTIDFLENLTILFIHYIHIKQTRATISGKNKNTNKCSEYSIIYPLKKIVNKIMTLKQQFCTKFFIYEQKSTYKVDLAFY